MEQLMEDRATRLTITLFSYIGQMKHRPLMPRLISSIATGLFLSIFSVMQIIKIYQNGMTLEIMLRVLPPTTCTLVCCALIVMAAFNGKQHDLISKFVVSYTEEMGNKGEDLIKKKYANEMKIYVVCYSLFMFSFIVAAGVWGFKSQILDIILPLNESRPREFVFEMYNIVNEEEHFYFVTFYQNIMTITTNVVVTTIQNTFIIIVHFACTMFAIVGHRVENLTLFDDVDVKEKYNYRHLILSKLISCVRGHCTAIQCARWIHTTCNIYLFLSLLATVSGLTFSLAAVANPKVRDLKTILLCSVLFMQYFLLSLLGQKLMDTSTEIPNNVCNSRWYKCPENVQKFLTLIVLRSHNPSTIVMSSLFVLSLENFCSVIKTAVSFCMVVRQFQ